MLEETDWDTTATWWRVPAMAAAPAASPAPPGPARPRTKEACGQGPGWATDLVGGRADPLCAPLEGAASGRVPAGSPGWAVHGFRRQHVETRMAQALTCWIIEVTPTPTLRPVTARPAALGLPLRPSSARPAAGEAFVHLVSDLRPQAAASTHLASLSSAPPPALPACPAAGICPPASTQDLSPTAVLELVALPAWLFLRAPLLSPLTPGTCSPPPPTPPPLQESSALQQPPLRWFSFEIISYLKLQE